MSYVMAGRQSELERLRLQSQVWEPAGERLLHRIGDGAGLRALDVGCGAQGWLRILARWVGPSGTVVGSDNQRSMLDAAAVLVHEERLANVTLVEDDLFASSLEPASFDLVHARFELAPLGRFTEQLAAHRRLVKSGGVVVLEEPDIASWRFNPDAPHAQRLVELIEQAFASGGGDFSVGRRVPELLGDDAEIAAEVLALPPGHPYLRLPLQFAASLEQRLVQIVGSQELDNLRRFAEEEIGAPERWGTTFTLIQAWRRY